MRPNYISSQLQAQWAEPPWGSETRFELGPALQQASALPSELRCTLTIIFFSYSLPRGVDVLNETFDSYSLHLNPSFEVCCSGIEQFQKSLDLCIDKTPFLAQNYRSGFFSGQRTPGNTQKQLPIASKTYKSVKSQHFFLVFSALVALPLKVHKREIF
jgi:hypothetical protein